MVLTAGIISLISAGSNSVKLSSTAASGGTAPYTQQWYRDTSGPSFTPGPSNLISGATSLLLNNLNLIPNTTYYFKVVYTDAVPDTVESTAFTVTTLPASQNINQFAMAPFLGEMDLKVGPQNVVAAQIDVSQSTPLYAGQPVKFVNNTNGIPTLVAAGTDMPNGYIVYDIKSQNYPAGARCEIARTLSCIWLYSTAAIERGSMVVLDPEISSGVKQATASTNLPIVGEAFDEASATGQLIRIILKVPSNMYDNASSSTFLIPTQQIFRGGEAGTYFPPSSPRKPLYIRLQMCGGGGGGAGSWQGNTPGGFGAGGGDTSFGVDFLCQGGNGGTLDPGEGGDCNVPMGIAGYAFKGQAGAEEIGYQYDTAFDTAPYRILQAYLPGPVGGNSLFAGAGTTRFFKDGINGTGGGGAGGHINANTENGLIFNAGTGGGGGGYLDYILPPSEYEGGIAYEVGGGGAGGTAGVNGNAGGAGADGIIIITEFYQ